MYNMSTSIKYSRDELLYIRELSSCSREVKSLTTNINAEVTSTVNPKCIEDKIKSGIYVPPNIKRKYAFKKYASH